MMKQDQKENSRKRLTRKEMLLLQRSGRQGQSSGEYDEASQKALEGLTYQKEDLHTVFNRMEQQLGLPGARQQRLRIRTRLAFAASLLLLLSVGYLALWPESGASGQERFAAHFEAIPYADGDASRGNRNSGAAGTPDLLSEAILAYNQKDFRAAEGLFRVYLEAHPADQKARFYYGITLLERGAAEPAARLFREVKNRPPEPAFQRPATWYLGLSLLQQGQEAEAFAVLQPLTGRQDRYGQSAAEILQGH